MLCLEVSSFKIQYGFQKKKNTFELNKVRKMNSPSFGEFNQSERQLCKINISTRQDKAHFLAFK